MSISFMLLKMVQNKYLTNLGLVMFLTTGIFITIISRNIFIMWVGLEINMFGVIPLLKISFRDKRPGYKVSFYYFFVQVIGSILFLWGVIISWERLRIIGLLCKLGLVPFFWWVPPLYSRLRWFNIGILRVIQKIPGLFLILFLFDLSLKKVLVIGLRRFIIGIFGVLFSFKKLKNFLAWSSLSKLGVMLILRIIKRRAAILFFCLYSVSTLGFCWIVSICKTSSFFRSFLKKEEVLHIAGLLLLIMSGLPPLVGFFIKVVFFSCFFAVFSYWELVIFMVILISCQMIGYVKAFIKLKSYFKKIREINLKNKGNKNGRVVVSIITFFSFSLFLLI